MPSQPKEAPLDKAANSALTGLLLMPAGTFALAFQDLRGLVEVLGVGPLRGALVCLAIAAVLAFFAKAIVAVTEAIGLVDDLNPRWFLVTMAALVLASVAAYAIAVVIVVVALHEPGAVAPP